MVFDPASQRLAVVFPGKEVSVWDVSQQPRRLASMPGNYTGGRLRPGGTARCPSSQGNSLTISDPEEGEAAAHTCHPRRSTTRRRLLA